MKILFATCQPFLPQMFGGLQSSAHELALALKAEGHEVGLLTALMPDGYLGKRGRLINKLLGKNKAACDHLLGYPAWRAWFPAGSLAWVASRFRPDVVVVLARQPVRVAQAAQRVGLPVLMVLQDVEFGDHGGDFATLGKVPCVANSAFTASRYRSAFGVEPVIIQPLINGHEKYATETTRENVTLINPHPFKGVNVAIELARQCPDIPFVFVETWPLSPEDRATLNARLSQVPNVKLLPSTNDMKQIYGKCKILLAPSQWEEAYGRVASEAQFSGIPVLASDRGGLPEAVGPGGVVLNPDGAIDHWVNALRKLWTDTDYYNQLSIAARQYASRPELQWSHQARMWQAILETAKLRSISKANAS